MVWGGAAGENCQVTEVLGKSNPQMSLLSMTALLKKGLPRKPARPLAEVRSVEPNTL